MSAMNSFMVSGFLAIAAFWLARGIGIPVWRDWEPGDARAEAERWAAQALKEEECRIAWQAERDRLAARLSENNRWPDPLQSPQAEAIRNGKIDMTEIVSLFDKMERELEQLRLVAADNARLEAENDNGGDLTRCEFCGRPILGRIVMDVNFTPSCEECAGAAAIQDGDE